MAYKDNRLAPNMSSVWKVCLRKSYSLRQCATFHLPATRYRRRVTKTLRRFYPESIIRSTSAVCCLSERKCTTINTTYTAQEFWTHALVVTSENGFTMDVVHGCTLAISEMRDTALVDQRGLETQSYGPSSNARHE